MFTGALLKATTDKEEKTPILAQKAKVITFFGIACDGLGIFPQVLKYHIEALKLHEAIGDCKSSAGAYNNIRHCVCSVTGY